MLYLAEFHWGWVAAAAFIGLLTGWVGTVHRGGGLAKRTLQWCALALVVAIACAVGRVVPGRFGYWLDLGLLLFAAYIVGCALGAWLRDLLIADHRSAP
jgi:hypothetical protein